MKWEYRLRLWSGLVIAAFVVGHLTNHALGIISIDAMESMRNLMGAIWGNRVGTSALYGSLLVHFMLALWSVFKRRSLSMPAWEAAQTLLGLLIPILLMGHIIETKGATWLLERKLSYPYVINALWHFDGPFGIPLALKQTALVITVWLHLCLGLHYWLRFRPRYATFRPLLFALAVLLPCLSLIGFAKAGFTLAAVVRRMGGADALLAGASAPSAAELARFTALQAAALPVIVAAFCLVLLARALRNAWQRRQGINVYHSNGDVLSAPRGQTLLETIRTAGVAHASVCGGRGRCTTCRVRVGRGADKLLPPNGLEADALKRIGAAPNVRLACQTHLYEDVWITPLLTPSPTLLNRSVPGGVNGRERPVAIMFIDLRDSTALGEAKLPYDVVFILNQFFAEMSQALRATGGHYAQFNGDGLMALYGLQSDLHTGCKAAFRGAADIQARLDTLNEHLADELPAPLRVGIGLHAGDAIVGTMGPPDSPIYSAIGDSVNIASRLEPLSKEFSCTFVVSAETAQLASLDLADFQRESVVVRGRRNALDVIAISDPRDVNIDS